MIRRDPGRRHVPRRHQARHHPSSDPVRRDDDSRRILPRATTPIELNAGRRDAPRSRSPTAAIGRFRSARTATSSKSTAGSSFDRARGLRHAAEHRRPAPRSGSSRATRAKSSWWRSAARARCPGSIGLVEGRARRSSDVARARGAWKRVDGLRLELPAHENRPPHLRRPLRPDDRRPHPPRRHRSAHPRSSATRRPTATRRSSAAAR